MSDEMKDAREALAEWDAAWAAIGESERQRFTGRDPQLRASVDLAAHRCVDGLRVAFARVAELEAERGAAREEAGFALSTLSAALQLGDARGYPEWREDAERAQAWLVSFVGGSDAE